MFKKELKDFNMNVFNELKDSWALITAGGVDDFTCMTVSWGGFGYLFNKNVCYLVVRPTRNTYKYLENNERFTLSFFEDKYKDALSICGSVSGIDCNKYEKANLTPVYDIDNNIYYAKEAKYVFKLKKISYQDFDPQNFLDSSLEKHYPLKDYHRMYIAEITTLLVAED